jgi:hypothetical protein
MAARDRAARLPAQTTEDGCVKRPYLKERYSPNFADRHLRIHLAPRPPARTGRFFVGYLANETRDPSLASRLQVRVKEAPLPPSRPFPSTKGSPAGGVVDSAVPVLVRSVRGQARLESSRVRWAEDRKGLQVRLALRYSYVRIFGAGSLPLSAVPISVGFGGGSGAGAAGGGVEGGGALGVGCGAGPLGVGAEDGSVGIAQASLSTTYEATRRVPPIASKTIWIRTRSPLSFGIG